MNDIPLKRCTKCGQEFPTTPEFFYRQPRGRFGVEGQCKTCRNIVLANYRKTHKQQIQEYQHRYNKNNKEKIVAKSRRWYAKNKKRAAKNNGQWYQKNKERNADRSRAWRLAHNEESRNAWHRYRARKLNAKGTHTAEDIQRQYASQEGRCW